MRRLQQTVLCGRKRKISNGVEQRQRANLYGISHFRLLRILLRADFIIDLAAEKTIIAQGVLRHFGAHIRTNARDKYGRRGETLKHPFTQFGLRLHKGVVGP